GPRAPRPRSWQARAPNRGTEPSGPSRLQASAHARASSLTYLLRRARGHRNASAAPFAERRTPASGQKPPPLAGATRPGRSPPTALDLGAGPWHVTRPKTEFGEVAKRLGNGLQNRHTWVRIPSSPQICPTFCPISGRWGL